MNEPPSVVIVAKDDTALDTTNDNVLKKVGNIETCGSWHVGRIGVGRGLSQQINNVPGGVQQINNVPGGVPPEVGECS